MKARVVGNTGAGKGPVSPVGCRPTVGSDLLGPRVRSTRTPASRWLASLAWFLPPTMTSLPNGCAPHPPAPSPACPFGALGEGETACLLIVVMRSERQYARHYALTSLPFFPPWYGGSGMREATNGVASPPGPLSRVPLRGLGRGGDGLLTDCRHAKREAIREALCADFAAVVPSLVRRKREAGSDERRCLTPRPPLPRAPSGPWERGRRLAC